MNLPSTAVNRKITFLMVFILMGGAGLFALAQLGLDYFPRVSLGKVMIITVLPGGAPEEVETLVTKVIEDAVSGVEGVTRVESSSGNSLSGVFVYVSNSADIEEVEQDVKDAVNSIGDKLPEQCIEPLIKAMESSMKPLLFASVSSNELDSGELRMLVEEEIVPVLSRVSGISSCAVMGGEERQINVSVNPVLLHLRGIGISEVYGALNAVAGNQPGGTIESRGTEVFISVKTGFTSLEEIGETVIGAHGGIPVRLRDVAEISDSSREQSSTTRLDGENSVILVFRKSGDANTVNTCRLLEARIAETAEDYSGILDLEVIYTQQGYVVDTANNLAFTGVQAVILAALVLMFFLGSAVNAGIVSITMPLCFVSTFAAMYLLGVNLNIMSLAGLSISIGMIVDNSVVVLENIHRKRREGSGAAESAVDGTAEIGKAVAASTLTTVAVFIPMLFVKGMTGEVFRDLSITIASSLSISLFLAMTIIPLMASRSGNLIRRHRPKSLPARIERGLGRLDSFYEQLLGRLMKRRFLSLLPVILLFVLSTGLFRFIPTSFLPDIQEGIIYVDVSLSQGTSLDYTDSVAAVLADSVRGIVAPGDLKHILLETGRQEGFGAVFGSDASCRISISVYMVSESEISESVYDYSDRIREYLSTVPGIRYSLRTGDPIGNEYPVQINVYGTDLAELKAAGDLLVRELEKIPGTEDANHSLEDWFSQLEYHPDDAVLSMRGVSRARLASEITLGMLGLNAAVMNDDGNNINVNVRYASDYRSSREAVAALPVLGAPLDYWGEFRSVLAPNSISRLDRSRVVSVFCKLNGRALGDVASNVNAMMDTLDIGNKRWEVTGDIEDQAESFHSMRLAILVAIILVYMVMASQFESLLEPFILIFEIPLALIGVIWILFITGTTMGMTALVGILMLIGIVVNNGIVLVDYANQLRREKGMDLIPATLLAGRTRLKPILMTALTTILALVPLSLGGSSSAALWAPMARTVIGGMVAATPLTLVVVPLLYVMMGRKDS
ncbi:hypothetical protein CSA37_01160 [Candidatus Fermentibacteria bacterium]|nr:MAG: hypothetical protein CSA37_01160 [Candidatus Fermentibacteria bacterium]